MKSNHLIAFAVAALLFAAGCVHTEPFHKLVDRAKQSAVPEKVDYQMRRSLEDFGAMVRAYTCRTEPIVVEIKVAPNDSGVLKDLPKDLGIYVTNAFLAMGQPFVVTRPISDAGLLETPAASAINTVAQKSPTPMIRVRGVLSRDPERVVRGREVRGSLSGKINGGRADADAGADDSATARNFRVAFYLEDAEGRSLSGPMALFEVWHRNDEADANVSLYFQGSGAGYNSKIQINQDAGDAALNATAAAMIHLVGKWLELPYWRTHPLFAEDRQLENSQHRSLAAMADKELEVLAKKYLFGSGLNFDVTQPGVSDSERALMHAEMRKAHYRPDKREEMETFLTSLWRNLDYRAAAGRLDDQVARATRAAREQQLVQQEALPERDLGPVLPSQDNKTVRISLARLPAAARATLVDHLKGFPTVTALRISADAAVCELDYGGDPSVLQAALRRSPDLASTDYIWQDLSWRSLEIVPL